MELANCFLHIGNESLTPLRSITPAEAMLLVSMHKDRAKKHPLVDLKIIGTAQSVAVAAEVQPMDEMAQSDITLPDGRTIAKGETIRAGTVTKAAKYRARTALEELARLKTKYQKQYLDKVFPSGSTTVPDTFADAEKTWVPVPVTNAEQVGNWTDEPGPLPKGAPVSLTAKV